MHASSDIRYLKMSKSCKTDTNSYGAVAFPGLLRRKARTIKYGHQVFWTFNCLPIYLARERCGNPGLWNHLAGCAFDQGGTVGLPSPQGRLQPSLVSWRLAGGRISSRHDSEEKALDSFTSMCDIRCPDTRHLTPPEPGRSQTETQERGLLLFPGSEGKHTFHARQPDTETVCSCCRSWSRLCAVQSALSCPGVCEDPPAVCPERPALAGPTFC